MEEHEMIVVITTTIKGAYENAYKDKTKEDIRAKAKLWVETFGDIDKDLFAVAVKNHIRTSKYPPSPADIQEQLNLLQQDNTNDLWNKLRKAVSYYNIKEKFDALPEELKEWLGSATRLKELALIDIETFNTVTYGQFCKQIPTIQKRKIARAALPESIKEKIKLIGGTE